MTGKEREKRSDIRRRAMLWLAALVLSLLWATAALAEETVELHYGGVLSYNDANQIVELVNQQRAANGLDSLKQTGDLQEMAMVRAMEIALYYDHTRPDGTRGIDMMGTGVTRAENIAVGYKTTSDVMEGWMNSSGHRANILNKSVTQIGVGCFYSEGTFWWVQLFRSGSGGSGTVKTGIVNSAIKVKARPSILDIHLVKAGEIFTPNSAIAIEAGETASVIAVNRNVAASSGILPLYAASPGLTWKSDGGFTVTTSASSVGASLYAGTCGSRTLTLSWGSRSVQSKVSIACVPENGTNCTKDIRCRFCGTVLQNKAGHSVNTSCTAKACTKCGEMVPPTKAHTPNGEATCQSASYCKVCGTKLQDVRGHSYKAATCQAPKTCIWCGATTGGCGDHVWGSWFTSGNWRTRRCTVCRMPQTEQIGQSKPGSSTGSSASNNTSGNKKVSSLKITGSSSLTAGKSTTLKVSVSPTNATNKAVTWSSSNTKYATVSSKGVVTAKSAGAGKTVTITAKAKDGSGKKAVFKISIKKASKVKVKTIKITGKTSVLAGKKITLKAKVSPTNASNKAVTWSSSNKKYATVSSKGVVTAKAAGAGKTVTITAKAKDGSGKKATFKVKIKGAVSKITLKGSKTLKAGKSTTIKATVKVGKGGSKALSWSSSNKKYATVSSKGVVKAKKAGKGKTVTITAKAKDGSGKKTSIRIKIK